jgi:hypothetical protein
LIIWPAIIKYTGVDELVYVENLSTWDADKHLSSFRYEATDKLIDSSGRVYALQNTVNGAVMPEPTGNSASLDEVIGMVRAHASQMGTCCTAKFFAASIQEAVDAVRS